MDGCRFDALTKALGAQRSRRGVLGAIAGAALASLGRGNQAEARACRSAGNSCVANGDCCSNNCVTESRTRKICHCVSPSDCPAGDQCRLAVCAGGSCELQTLTGASCDDGDPCTINDICHVNGSCSGSPKNCDDNNACTLDACNPANGQCTNTTITCDDHNLCTIDTCNPATGCVFTPVVCTAPNECFTAGTCQSGSGLCSDPVYHGDQATCSAGVCHANACCTPELPATTCAGGKCGPQTNNCGQTVPCLTLAGGVCAQDGECCSAICVTDAQGLNGVCQAGPVALGGACDSNGDCASHSCCGNVCRDVSADPDHCGACATVCSSNNMATRTCSGGVCDGACAPGFSDCNGNKQTNGCETNIDNDPDNCDGCGVACSNNNMAARTCTSGVCDGTCLPGFSDCTGDKQTNGCETNTSGDPDNCGACGTVCSNNHMATRTCTAGVCTGTCASGFGDCDGNKQTNGCETDLATDQANCGFCGHVCTGAGVTCGGSGAPGFCGCTSELSTVTCAGGKCGTSHINNCGLTVDCGGCAPGYVCMNDGSFCKNTNPFPACAGHDAFCRAEAPCGEANGDTCDCFTTVENGGVCGQGGGETGFCTTSADCPGSQLCGDLLCNGIKFCLSINPCA